MTLTELATKVDSSIYRDPFEHVTVIGSILCIVLFFAVIGGISADNTLEPQKSEAIIDTMITVHNTLYLVSIVINTYILYFIGRYRKKDNYNLTPPSRFKTLALWTVLGVGLINFWLSFCLLWAIGYHVYKQKQKSFSEVTDELTKNFLTWINKHQ